MHMRRGSGQKREQKDHTQGTSDIHENPPAFAHTD
jgi:hypothetical protein